MSLAEPNAHLTTSLTSSDFPITSELLAAMLGPPPRSSERLIRDTEERLAREEYYLRQLKRELSGRVELNVPIASFAAAYFSDVNQIASMVQTQIPKIPDLTTGEHSLLQNGRAFAAFLNTILDTICCSMPEGTQSYYRYLRFWEFAPTSLDPVMEDPPVYMVAGSQSEPLYDKEGAMHDDFTIIGVIHSSFDILIHHASQHLCRMTGMRRHRFSTAIMLNEGSAEAYVALLHYGNLAVSESLSLREADGIAGLGRVLAGVLSWKDAWAAGIDPTRVDDQVAVPGGLIYKLEASLCRRSPLRGCSTSAELGHRLNPQRQMRKRKAAQLDDAEALLPPRKSPRLADLSRTATLRRTTHGLVFPIDGQSSVDEVPLATASWPERVVIKDTYPEPNRPNDHQVFGGMGDQFGVPKVVAAYEVGGVSNRIRSLEGMELRVHTRTVIETIGVPLTTAGSPRVLIRGVLHAMFGALSPAFDDSFAHCQLVRILEFD